MDHKPKVMMSVGNAEIEEYIMSLNVDVIENEQDIDLIADVLQYEQTDFVILNSLLSARKVISLAMRVKDAGNQEFCPKIIALLEDYRDKTLIAHLVGLDVFAFAVITEPQKIKQYLQHYPDDFDFRLIAPQDEGIRGASEVVKGQAEKRIPGTVSIGVFGVSPGAGATSTAISISEEIALCGYRVICLEIGTQNFRHLDHRNYRAEYISTEEAGKGSVLQIAYSNQEYQFLVIDFGTIFVLDDSGGFLDLKHELIDDFLRCNYKIGCMFSDPWHCKKLEFFIKNDLLQGDMMAGTLFFIASGKETELTIKDYHELDIVNRIEQEQFLSGLLEQMGITAGLELKPPKQRFVRLPKFKIGKRSCR